MNILDMFEERASAIFGESPSGQATPFSFKKLAKRAARAMENETYTINNVDTAPALYTVLISEPDAQMIQPLYAQLTREASQFVKSQAKKQGYAFVGEPLFRFIPDPSLKSGKFSVFAENVDVHTLRKLREEELSYMGGQQGEQQSGQHYAAQNFAEHEVGLQRIPDDFGMAASPAAANNVAELPVMPVTPGTPAPVVPNAPVVGSAAGSMAAPGRAANAVGSAAVAGAAIGGAVAASSAVGAAAASSATHAASGGLASCLLIDRSTGRTYTAAAPSSIIGRERTPRGIVLHDPNVSRRHAELSFDGADWRIRDLNSTNGTLINSVDIDECILRNGDIITVGVCTLEFKGD